MKYLKYIISIAVLVLIGGYTAYWYSQASKLEKSLKGQIEQIAQDKSQGYQFQYDSIESSGYPFDITIALKNPKIKSIPSDPAQTPVEINLDGKINDKFNIFGQLKAIEFVGKTQILIPESSFNKARRFLLEGKIVTETDSESLIPDSVLNQLSSLVSSENGLTLALTEVWNNLDNGKFILNGVKLSDATSGTMISEIDQATFRFKRNKSKEDRQSFDFSTIVKGLNYDTFYAYLASLEEKTEYSNMLNAFYHALYSRMGKLNFALDFSVDLPSQEQLMLLVNSPTGFFFSQIIPSSSIVLNKFDADTKFGTFSSTGNISLKETEENRVTLNLAFDTKQTNTKEYVTAAQSAVDEASKEAEKFRPSNQEQENLKILLTKNVDDVKAVIPKIDEFGTIRFSKEATLDFDKKKLEANFKLSKLDFISALYGARLAGDIKGSQENYSGSMTLDISKYKELIQDAVSYYNRVVKVLNILQSEQKIPQVSQGGIQSIIDYAKAISNAPEKDSKDVSITASYLDGKTKVGTLSLEQYLQKTEELKNNLQKELTEAPLINVESLTEYDQPENVFLETFDLSQQQESPQSDFDLSQPDLIQEEPAR